MGLAIATELAKCGANVTLMARDEVRLRQIIGELPTTHPGQHHHYWGFQG
ncbi:hypothetical protein DU508_15310 [Pedobacter chinensis]|uniref:SDR family NAD(P)-dependent oxidoreductase n=1 Tax=Pedobacter chinensis TaxID=2282421 RepID=A0A369PSX0_9SPHI|nr:hypothetical protein DU508_15310 [Pedobacter chinensis]